jgi:hypothetical protein
MTTGRWSLCPSTHSFCRRRFQVGATPFMDMSPQRGSFVSHLFACPDVSPPPAPPSTTQTPQMEREMCSYLEWQLNVDTSTLRDSQNRVQRDFAGPGPYPPTVLPQPVPAPFAHQSTGNVNTNPGSSMPAFAPVPLRPRRPPLFPTPRSENTHRRPSIPQRHHPIPLQPLPRHRFRRKRRPNSLMSVISPESMARPLRWLPSNAEILVRTPTASWFSQRRARLKLVFLNSHVLCI